MDLNENRDFDCPPDKPIKSSSHNRRGAGEAHLSSDGEAQVQSAVMRTAAQTAAPSPLHPPSASPLASGSVSRGRSDQAHQGGAQLGFGLAVSLRLPQERPGLGEGGHRVPDQASWGPLNG